jgi:mannose-6-phosphate isomerase-like protein (cupin superfamily)
MAEGEIKIVIEGKINRPRIGEEVFIPANASHTVKNIGFKGNTGITDTNAHVRNR